MIPIMRKMNLVNVSFWTYLNLKGKRQAWGSEKRFSWALPRARFTRVLAECLLRRLTVFFFFFGGGGGGLPR